jgi:hypothetical protein
MPGMGLAGNPKWEQKPRQFGNGNPMQVVDPQVFRREANNSRFPKRNERCTSRCSDFPGTPVNPSPDQRLR